MNLPPEILGSTAVERLKKTSAEHVIQIGSDRLTRGQLVRVGCYNFTAAKNLSAIVKQLGVKNLRHLFDTVPPQALALPHLGVISLAVLGAAFEALRIGGDSPLETYITKHLAAGAKVRTFDTIKHREQAEVANERRDKKKRKAARRNQAHAIRTERFDEKQPQPSS